METFVPITFAITLIWKLVDFFKYLRAGQTNEWMTQLTVWVAATGVGFLLANSDFAGGVEVANTTLDKLNAASVLLFSLGLGSSASAAYEKLGSSQTPKLFNIPPK